MSLAERIAAFVVVATLGTACGHSSPSAAPTPGPYADIKGNYTATVVSGTGIYSSIAPGTTSLVTITDVGSESASSGMSINGYAAYTIHRQSDGSFITDAHNLGSSLGSSFYEIGSEPSDLSTFTLDATESWNDGFPHTAPAGVLVYAMVKNVGG